jgi:hypothetical protein
VWRSPEVGLCCLSARWGGSPAKQSGERMGNLSNVPSLATVCRAGLRLGIWSLGRQLTGTTEATWCGSSCGARAAVITVDATRASIEGDATVAGSDEVSGGLGRADEGGGSLGGSDEGRWSGSRSNEAGRSGAWSTYGFGSLLGSDEVGWAALGSNVGLGSLSRSNVGPSTENTCKAGDQLLALKMGRSAPARATFALLPPETIC